MADALGFIETKGLVGAVAAADAMVKSADITLIGKEITGPALVLIKIKGDLASVKYAVEAGELAAKNAGNFISSLVLSEPDSRLAAMLPEISTGSHPEITEKVEESAGTEISIENETDITSGKETGEIKNDIVLSQENEKIPDEVITDNNNETNNLAEDVKADNEPFNSGSAAEETDQIQPENTAENTVKRKISKPRKKTKKTAEADNIVEAHIEPQIKQEEAASSAEEENPGADVAPGITENEVAVINEPPVSESITISAEENINKSEAQNKGKRSKQKPKEYHATLFDSLFDPIEDDPAADEKSENEPVINSTIERLKNEALGNKYEYEQNAPIIAAENIGLTTEDAPINVINENKADDKEEEIAPVPEGRAVTKSTEPGKKIKKSKVSDKTEDESYASTTGDLSSDLSMDYLGTLNVHLLRKAARGVKGFPIQGREISKANRQVLLDHFSNLL